MRVLQIMAGRKPGGAETAFVDTVLALHEHGLEQHAVVRQGFPATDVLRNAGISVTELPFRKFFDFRTRPALKQVIAEYQPNIVQTWMNRASSSCPSGDFIHVGWFGGYYRKKAFKNCDYLVGVTQDICNHQISLGWPKDRVQHLRTFARIEPTPALKRSTFNTPQDVPLLLALARLHWKKGLDVLLKALVDVPNAYLWIAGDGPLRESLEKLAKDLDVANRVRFLGWRNDRGALLKAADVCVFPSRYEPFGTVIVEAWAYKVPLVTAASAGPKAHVEDGTNGLVVPIDDVNALASAIQRVIDEPTLAKTLVKNGFATYETLFTPAAVARAYIEFYTKIGKQKS